MVLRGATINQTAGLGPVGNRDLLATTTVTCLYRRAFDGAVGAEHTAIAGQRFQQFTASLAIVEKLAGIGRHGFHFFMTALRAGNFALLNQGYIKTTNKQMVNPQWVVLVRLHPLRRCN